MPAAMDVADADGGYEGRWVTVFGFPADNSQMLSAVLAEFQACGTIQHWTIGPHGNCNWMHIQFESAHGAQRALQRNGTRLGSLNLMVGVQPPSAADREYVSRHVEKSWAASSMRTAALPMRPYVLSSSSKMAPVPKPEKRWAQHFSEIVFGS